jgi:sphingolipid 8-(E/Z)-desaturase
MTQSLNRKSTMSLDPTLWYIHGKAYDLKDWIHEHPGGDYILKISRGTDCTELFEMYHSASLKDRFISTSLQKFQVQTKTSLTTTTYEWNKTPLYDDMKRVVHAYRRQHGVKGTDSSLALVWSMCWGLIHYYTGLQWMLGQGGISNAFMLGLSIWFWCANHLHNGTHYAVFYDTQLNEWCGWLGGWLFCLPSAWVRQHVVGHHVHTNTPLKDPDLYHYERLWYTTPQTSADEQTPTYWFLFFLAPLSTQWYPSLKGSIRLLRKNKWKGTHVETVWAPGEKMRLRIQWICLILLLLFVGLRTTNMAVMTTPFLVVSILYYAFSQVSHINGDSFKTPKSREWVAHQIATTRGDYAYDSLFWNLLSIGLNNQAFHHCFPTVHPCHFPALSHLLKPVFEKHGLPMHGWQQSYWQSLSHHVDHLRKRNTNHISNISKFLLRRWLLLFIGVCGLGLSVSFAPQLLRN